MICTNCYYQGKGKTMTRGSFAIELVLWIFFFWAFLIPPLVYSIWRLTTRKQVCPRCNQDTLIPEDTPRGEELVDKFRTRKGAENLTNNYAKLDKQTTHLETSGSRPLVKLIIGILFLVAIFWLFGISSQWTVIFTLTIVVVSFWWYHKSR